MDEILLTRKDVARLMESLSRALVGGDEYVTLSVEDGKPLLWVDGNVSCNITR